jgi:PAS domain S-box-containing protein
VLFLNRTESVELVNKSVSTLFGYTPEQLLGQPLSSILVAEQNPKVYEQTALMRNGESPLTFQTYAIGTTDDEQSIHVSLTVLGAAADEKSKVAQSFVVIMRDDTELRRQREESESAKKRSEELLYQILPRDIVVRLNHGEADISFSVPSASITFIDIVKFSEYAESLTPADIMRNLSMVFQGFDEGLARYAQLIKIKLIGDVYMAAGGLFSPEESPQTHAGQIVQFGLDAIAILEDVNAQLAANLTVRIGANTDGPLTAGVLGKDQPVFDIIGDPINTASRLQSTCEIGAVQISQSTFELVQRMGFSIEKRGEIFLKGKGKRMTYLVRPERSLQADDGGPFATQH